MKRRLFRFRDCGKGSEQFFVEKMLIPPSPAIPKLRILKEGVYRRSRNSGEDFNAYIWKIDIQDVEDSSRWNCQWSCSCYLQDPVWGFRDQAIGCEKEGRRQLSFSL